MQPKPTGSGTDPGVQYQPTDETLAAFKNITIKEPFNMTEAFNRLPSFFRKGRNTGRGRWTERYRTPLHYQESMKRIYALVYGLDRAIENIVKKVKELGEYENTLIIVTADNGTEPKHKEPLFCALKKFYLCQRHVSRSAWACWSVSALDY